jgi:hypothetical protein
MPKITKEEIEDYSPKAGEYSEIENGQYMTCCDCNLVHKIKYKIVDGKLFMRFWRNEKLTKKYRDDK